MSAFPAVDLEAPAPRAAAARPELLAPAGDWDCARAAVENGADAIYFGLERFNARMRARNFTQADLPDLMGFLHRRGVKGYVTFNTLVFTNELEEAEDYLRTIIRSGVDAAIVQDVGMVRMIRAMSADFPVHASTQMTITSAAGLDFARRLGAQLVVLARENSLAEIAAMQEAERARGGQAGPMPLEVFVHGALCVAYSGQCLTSEALGGRSANRGECAQACRMPYDLISDGRKVDLGDRKYLLSPQDLAGLDVLPELVRAGVASLKIEGRLKSPEYVASITRVYRQALDRVMAAGLPAGEGGEDGKALRGAGGEEGAEGRMAGAEREKAVYALEMSFSRGLYTGWFRGIHNQELAHGRFGKKRGVFLGRVLRVEREAVVVDLEKEVKPGDGVVFDAGRPEEEEEGGRIFSVDTKGREAVLRLGRGVVNWRRVQPGDRVWKTSDPALERELRATYEGGAIRFQRPVGVAVHGREGEPLSLEWNDGEGQVVKVESEERLTRAEKQGLDRARLEEQLGRLGGTPFRLGRVDLFLEGDLHLPLSVLNRLRREAVERLEALRAEPRRWDLREPARPDFRAGGPAGAGGEGEREEPELIVVARTQEQVEAALGCPGVKTIYCEFEHPRHYRAAVETFRRWRDGAGVAGQGATLWVAPPRIFKPGEEWILKQVRACEADGWIARNADHLRYFAGERMRGDFSFNVANPWTARYLREEYGLERVTASYDLNIQQLEALLEAAPGRWFDVTIHQHMPMFHMEHCVFCAFLSTGKDFRDCGRPCETHQVALRDRVGAELPLKADAGCRNTVYNNRAQTGAEYLTRLAALGVGGFRVEFVNEPGEEVGRTIDRYRRVLRGELAGAALWRELKLINQLGVTRGQMEAAPQVMRKK